MVCILIYLSSGSACCELIYKSVFVIPNVLAGIVCEIIKCVQTCKKGLACACVRSRCASFKSKVTVAGN